MTRLHRLVAGVLLGLLLGAAALAGGDAAGRVEYLGNPLKQKYAAKEAIFARNVWDMQLFDGRIFLGGGNSSNDGPAANAGPLPIIAYDLDTRRFVTEGTVYDEQIDIYKPIDGALFIPGNDATGSWKRGNFYERTPEGKWQMYRNIPDALHVYDLAKRGKTLFAGIGLYEGAAVGMTDDMGEHWKIVPLGDSRVYAFMTIDDTLLALKKFKRTSRPYFSVAQYLDGGTFSARFDIGMQTIFPDTRFTQTYARATRILPVGKAVLYTGGYKYGSHHTLPFGLYTASMHKGRFAARRIPLPEGTLPRDLLRRGDRLYLLTQQAQKGGDRVAVWSASAENLLEWKNLFYFTYPTFARSFEYDGRSFYFGMGCDADMRRPDGGALPEQTGDILKVTYEGKE